MPSTEARGVSNRAIEVVPRARERRAIVEPEREVGGNRRGQGAACSMGMPGVDSRAAQLEHFVCRADDVDRLRTVEVPALDEYDAGAELEDPSAGGPHVIDRTNRPPGQHLSLWDIGRHDMREREELRPYRRDGLLFEQTVAALGDHHWVDDDMRQVELGDRRRNGLDDGGVGEHADLDGIDAEVAGDSFDLRGHEIARDRAPHRHAECVLSRDRGDCARAEDLMCGEGLEIGLDAGATARVAARNCQCCVHKVRSQPMAVSATLLTTISSRSDVSVATRAAAVFFVAVLTAVAAQVSIPLPFTPVPFTLQPMIVLVGGAALGARLGLASQILYLTAGIVGLPVFAASPVLPQGFLRLLGPTGGFLMAYPLAAFVAGWLGERGFDRRYLTSVVAMAAGLSVIFAFGIAWFAWFASPAPVGLPKALQLALYPFIGVDILKILLAATVLPSAWTLTGRSRR